jgi:hypothetical protein
MKSVSGRELARIVERRGWTLLRVSDLAAVIAGLHPAMHDESRQRRTCGKFAVR